MFATVKAFAWAFEIAESGVKDAGAHAVANGFWVGSGKWRLARSPPK